MRNKNNKDEKKEKFGIIAIGLISIMGIIGVSMLDPIAQDLKYHSFIDQRTIFGVPNFWNVISNVPFLLVGLIGLRCFYFSNTVHCIAKIKMAYLLFFLGVSLVAFGSGYYHLLPNNTTLIWDRLPMTIAFMALFSIIIAEFISIRMGRLILWPLVLFGAFSVFYWQSTESQGEGDLRLYILVQFLPVITIPLILFIFNSKIGNAKAYWWLFGSYVLAKISEYFDEVIFNALYFVSGHSIKHVIAAIGVFILIKYYSQKMSVNNMS